MRIGVTGPMGAGKTTFVRYLSSKGFEHLSLSDFIRDEVARRDMVLTRESLQNVGNQMRQKYGLGVWAQKALEIMRPGQNYVIDSIRNPGEIAALAAVGDFILLAVTAPLEARFARMSRRSEREEKEPATLAAFKMSEARETGSSAAHSQHLDECARLARITIDNNSGMPEFFAKIDRFLDDMHANVREPKII